MKRFFAVSLLLTTGAVRAQVAASEPALAFDEALVKVVESHAGVARQSALRDAAAGRSFAQSFYYTPSLSLEGAHLDDSATHDPQTTAQGTLRANLWRGGADLASAHAAGADLTAESEQLVAAQINAEAETVRALVGVVRSRYSAGLQRDLVDIQERVVKAAASRYERGLVPAQELDKARIDLENAKIRVREAEQSERLADAELARLAGGPVRLRLEWPWKRRLTELKLADGESEKIESTPALRAVEARRESAESLRASRWRLLSPSLDAEAARGWLLDDRSPYWSWQLTLSFPLWDGGSRIGRAREQGALAAAARAAEVETRRDVESQLPATRGALRMALETAQTREQTAALAEKLYDTSLQRFKLGHADVNNLALDFQRLTETRALAIVGWAEAHIAVAEFCRTRGQRLTTCWDRIH